MGSGGFNAPRFAGGGPPAGPFQSSPAGQGLGAQVWACNDCAAERRWGCGHPSLNDSEEMPWLVCEGKCSAVAVAGMDLVHTRHHYVRTLAGW